MATSKRFLTTLFLSSMLSIAAVFHYSTTHRHSILSHNSPHSFSQIPLSSPHRLVVPESPDDEVEWSNFAYVQYVTHKKYLCNSVLIFEALHRLRSRPDRVLLYPSSWDT